MFTSIAAGLISLRNNPDIPQDLIIVLEQMAAGYTTRDHRGPLRIEVDGYATATAPVQALGDPEGWPLSAATFRNPASYYDLASGLITGGVAVASQGVVLMRPNDGGIGLVVDGDAAMQDAYIGGDVFESDGTTLYTWPNFGIDDASEYWEAGSVANSDTWGRASGYPLIDCGGVARASGWLTDNAWDFTHTTGDFLSSGSVSLDYSQDWSIVLAVNIDTLSGYDPVLWSYGDNGTTKPLFCRVNVSGGTIGVVATDNGTTARTTTGTTALVVGTNYLLGFTWDASSETLSIYIDGELETSADLSAYTWPTFTDPQLRIGNRVDNTTGQELDGQVDTVLVMDSCLSARQMKWYAQAQSDGAFIGGDRGVDVQDEILASGIYGGSSLWR